MNQQLGQNLPRPQPPQFHHTTPVDKMSVIEDLIFRTKKDVIYGASVALPRRRIEWPTVEMGMTELGEMAFGGGGGGGDSDDKNEIVSDETSRLIQWELQKCDTREGNPEDTVIYTQQYKKRGRQWRSVLINLYWRAHRQSSIWDLFCLLCCGGLINIECLIAPIHIYEGSFSREASLVEDLLECFEFVHGGVLAVHQDKIPL